MGAPQRPSLKELRDGKSSIIMEAHRSIFRITPLLPLVGIAPPTVEPPLPLSSPRRMRKKWVQAVSQWQGFTLDKMTKSRK